MKILTVVPTQGELDCFLQACRQQGYQAEAAVAGKTFDKCSEIAPVQNRFLLTLFFLDEPSPELESAARPGWRVNRPPLPQGDAQRRASLLHRAIAEFDPFPEAQVILTDGRDLDPGERQALAGSAVVHLTDVRALLDRPLPARPLYIHFDTDIIDPNDAPEMSYRARGGPSAADLAPVLRFLARSVRVVAVSVTTWTPRLDGDGRSQAVCLELLDDLIGP